MFELSWKKPDGTVVHYWNLNGELVQNTILMDIERCPDLNPATIRIRGMDKPAKAYVVNSDGERVTIA